MADTIAVAGVIGTIPQRGATNQGVPFVNFRLASNRRRFNQATETWEDAGTNWYSVAAYGNLARNLGQSVSKGAHVIVAGRLQINEWKTGEKSGVTVELVADAAGHDLTWGTTLFTRSVAAAPKAAIPDAPENESGASNATPELVRG